MGEILISFCIATFQRYEILKELVLEILSVKSNQIEVVVCDDCSKDNSVDKIKEIKDSRLNVWVNDINVGSSQNIYEALERGTGKYIFYVNDRDNVDAFKIEKLIEIIEELDKKNVAFFKCINEIHAKEKYRIFESGEEAMLEFACRIDHPTGYIFRRDVWKKIKFRKMLFKQQCYGDYPITMICAIMSLKYSGARIFGDICDFTRFRIDFAKVKSGYYAKRQDKRVWYSPEVQWREIMIAYNFLKKIDVEEDLIDKILCLRYEEYIKRVVVQYKEMISEPYNTLHYNLRVSQNLIIVYIIAIRNGFFVWKRMRRFWKTKNKRELVQKSSDIAKTQFQKLFNNIYRDLLEII